MPMFSRTRTFFSALVRSSGVGASVGAGVEIGFAKGIVAVGPEPQADSRAAMASERKPYRHRRSNRQDSLEHCLGWYGWARVSNMDSANREGHDRVVTHVLGIVGGTGPESTVDYYRTIIAEWQRRTGDGSYPRLIINSVEAGGLFRLLAAGDYAAVTNEIGKAIAQLAWAGADAALLASNAMHLAFDGIAASSPIPLIHIVDTAVHEAAAQGYRRLGLFGTRYVMESPMYPDRFAAAGMTIISPPDGERAQVHEKYTAELVRGVFLDETRDLLVAIIERMRDRDKIDGLILGGTELALILTEASYAAVPMLNTARTHADAAVDWLLDGRSIHGEVGKRHRWRGVPTPPSPGGRRVPGTPRK